MNLEDCKKLYLFLLTIESRSPELIKASEDLFPELKINPIAKAMEMIAQISIRLAKGNVDYAAGVFQGMMTGFSIGLASCNPKFSKHVDSVLAEITQALKEKEKK